MRIPRADYYAWEALKKKRQWRSTILHAEERARKTVDIGE
jgi:hypothetical protein